jgi:hypothetical protein
MTLAGIRKVIREIHSEPGPNGTLSWGRIAATASLVAAIVWVSHLVFRSGTLPSLDGISGFVVAPYAANRVATAVQSFSQNPVAPAAPAPVPPPPQV